MSHRNVIHIPCDCIDCEKTKEIVEALEKRIGEVTPSAPYNIRHGGLVWTPEVFSILKIELNKIKKVGEE